MLYIFPLLNSSTTIIFSFSLKVEPEKLYKKSKKDLTIVNKNSSSSVFVLIKYCASFLAL